MSTALENEFIDQLFTDLKNDTLVLPTLPEIALRVKDVLEDHDSSLADVVHVIVQDTALSARLIQVSNSPLLRGTHTIESVDSAVMRMGGNMVKNLVTSIAMEQMFQATSDVTDKRLRAIWQHSTEVAAITFALSENLPGIKPDEAMLAGLVHDIGALPILSRAEDCLDLINNESLLDQIIARAHPEIGKAILEHWNFPAELVVVPAEHENLQYDSFNGPDYVDLVIVANLQSLAGSSHPHSKVNWSEVPAFEKLGLSTDMETVDLSAASTGLEPDVLTF